jgi:hypothetical protein
MVNEFIRRVLLDDSDRWIIRQRVYKKWHRVYWKYKSRNNALRILGEWYVADNLNWQFRRHGLHQSFKKMPNSYYMKYQYDPVLDKKRIPTGTTKNRGLDIYARLVDSDNTVYNVGIEVYNWRGKYHSINDYIYNTRIKDKFTQYDKANRMLHVICMNKRNIPIIRERCKRDNISIIPLMENVTPELIDRLIKRGLIKPEFDKLEDIEDYNNAISKEFMGQ